jgi:NAD(P)-dependent dehydrogenase (short-subunit alcohol dehydrogenase family)
MPQDPKDIHPKPPFPAQKQDFPGSEEQMQPKPDSGAQSYQGSGKLKDKVALITGGDSGIGRAVAIAYAKEGADVVISYFNEHEDAAETVKEVEQAGRKGLALSGDIQDEKNCQLLVNKTLDEFKKLDILINNAAYQKTVKSITEITTEDFDRVMKTNVYAMFFLCRAALPVMQPGSSIINTASIQAYQPSPNLLHYATTKGAIVTFTKALSGEAIKKGIRVNAVAPGPIWTPLIPSTMPEERVSEFGADTPLERAGQPSEVAPVFVFLASEDASYITAQVIGVTGGKPLN